MSYWSKILLTGFLLMAGIAHLYAQLDSIAVRWDTNNAYISTAPPTANMSPQLITDSRPKHTGCKQISLSGEILEESSGKSLSEVLAANSTIFIRSNGPGILSTSTFRGLPPEHTNVLWNGLPVNSPAIGQTDLSLYPVNLLDEVSLDFGAGSLTYFSGGFGGSINLISRENWRYDYKNEVHINQSIGSFGNYRGDIGVHYALGRKLRARTSLVLRSADNDFPYKDLTTAGFPETRQYHAELMQYGIQQELYLQVNSQNHLSLKTWLQDSDRNLPSSMGISPTYENQKDKTARSVIAGEFNRRTGMYGFNVGHAFEQIHYTYPQIGVDALSWSQIFIGQFLYRPNASTPKGLHWIREAGTNLQFSLADAQEFAHTENRLQGAAFLQAGHRFEKLRLYLGLHLRQEFYDDKLAPFLPSIGIEWRILKKKNILDWNAHFSRNFNMPALNALYWIPGGNPDLASEKGWSGETGLDFRKLMAPKTYFIANVTAFGSLTQDMILWIPSGSSGIWAPQNVREVLVRGLESSLKVQLEKKVRWSFSANYSYTRSETRKSNFASDGAIGKQLIYVPIHNLNLRNRLEWKGFYLLYTQIWTGKRFVTRDNSDEVPGFITGDVSLGKIFRKNENRITLQLTARNLWNTQYQIVRNRPMPGRSFEGMVGIKF